MGVSSTSRRVGVLVVSVGLVVVGLGMPAGAVTAPTDYDRNHSWAEAANDRLGSAVAVDDRTFAAGAPYAD